MVKTFDEWKLRGGFTQKGSKAVGRNERGESLFAAYQISYPRTYFYSSKSRYNDFEDYGQDGGIYQDMADAGYEL
jgi:hypothetical protein